MYEEYRLAYVVWSSITPDNCRCSSHWTQGSHEENPEPKPDDTVCMREQAWRRYTQVRDAYMLVGKH
jgi:hypothetical protein